MAKDGTYFQGDRSFWDDGDFETLEQKAVYAMLWQAHGTDIAGIRTRNDKLDAVRVCIPYDQFQHTLFQLETMGKIKLFPKLIWVKAALWRNLGKGRFSKLQMTAVVGRLRSCTSTELVIELCEYNLQKYGFEIPYTYPSDISKIPYCSESESESEPESKSISSDISESKKPEAALKKPKPRKQFVEYSEEVRALTNDLEMRLIENYPNLSKSELKEGSKVESWREKTAEAIRKMIDLDKRSPEEVARVIDLCQSDNQPNPKSKFCWAMNVRSGEALRNQFDQIIMRLGSGTTKRTLAGSAGNHGPSGRTEL